MRLTRFTDYSLRVLIYLGQHNETRVTIHQISEAYDISKNHLMKVVSNLSRLQIVVAQRGPGGGIQLNHSPEDITLNEVISNTEKNLQQIDSETKTMANQTSAESRLDSYLQQALMAYLETLGHFTLADVLDVSNESTELLGLSEKVA